MRTSFLSLTIAIGMSVATALSAQDSPAERAAVQRVLTRYAENVQSGNLQEVGALFAPNVHILTGTAALHSWAEYRDNHLRPETQRFTGFRYTHSGIETTVRGTVAWSNFRWQMAGSAETPAPILGRASAVFEKVNGSWAITMLHFSR